MEWLRMLPLTVANWIIAGPKIGDYKGHDRRELRFWFVHGYHVASWPFILHPGPYTKALFGKPFQRRSEPSDENLAHEWRHLFQQHRDNAWFFLIRYVFELAYNFLIRSETRFKAEESYLAVSYEVDARKWAEEHTR